MTSAVATGVTGLGLAKGRNRTVFRNPRGTGRYYSFYIDVDGSSNVAVVYEYSITGVIWSTAAVTVIDFGADASGGEVHDFDVKIHDDGSQLEVWVVAIGYDATDTAAQTKYVYGTISDASSTISWNTVQDIDAAITTRLISGADYCIALGRTDNGEIVVAFTEDLTNKGKDYRQIKLIGSDGDGAAPSWSGETTWDDPSGNNDNQSKGDVFIGIETFDSSYPDDFLIYARSATTNATSTYRLITAVPDWDQGGSGFTNTTIAAWGTAGTVIGQYLSAIIDESDIVHLVYSDFDGATTSYVYHRKAATAGDDDLGSATTVASGPGLYEALTCTLDTGPATDELYVFYNDTSTVDFHYRTTPVGTISFSSEFTVSYHQHITALTSWSREIDNSLLIGGLYGTTAIFNEQPVYLSTLSSTLADLQWPDLNSFLGPHGT
jgi:hypothetical protein